MIGCFLCTVFLDDLELFHLHCVDVVLGVHVHNLFNGSLRDPVLRYTVFDQSFRVRDLLHDFFVIC